MIQIVFTYLIFDERAKNQTVFKNYVVDYKFSK